MVGDADNFYERAFVVPEDSWLHMTINMVPRERVARQRRIRLWRKLRRAGADGGTRTHTTEVIAF